MLFGDLKSSTEVVCQLRNREVCFEPFMLTCAFKFKLAHKPPHNPADLNCHRTKIFDSDLNQDLLDLTLAAHDICK